MLVHDSIVLVTRASRGIGRQFAVGLLTRDTRRVYAVQMDITNRFEVEAAGRADSDLRLLINNAGVA
jgi:short-subunit dehydrogenase